MVTLIVSLQNFQSEASRSLLPRRFDLDAAQAIVRRVAEREAHGECALACQRQLRHVCRIQGTDVQLRDT